MKCIVFNCFILLMLLVASCSDETPHPDFYTGCCDTEPINQELSIGNVYIPNTFTPDGNGVNDLFYVHTGPFVNEVMIEEFTITSQAGEILFETFNTFTNSAPFGWDGEYQGEQYIGLFNYSVVLITEDGTIAEIDGSACAVKCDADISTNIENTQDCTFSLQHDGEGGFNGNLDSGENDCF